MEYKYDDLKAYLIKNGKKEEVGIGNNKRVVYDYKFGLIPEWKKNADGKCDRAITDYCFCISYDGLKAESHRYYHSYDRIRYNETTDCIQVGKTDGYYGKTKYKTLQFDENGRPKKIGGYSYLILNTGDDAEYRETFYNENIDEVIRIIKSNIKGTKSAIKEYEKRIKKFEKKLNEISGLCCG